MKSISRRQFVKASSISMLAGSTLVFGKSDFKLSYLQIPSVDETATSQFFAEILGIRFKGKTASIRPISLKLKMIPELGKKKHLIPRDNHIAFCTSELRSFKLKLKKLNVPYIETIVPGLNRHQVFFKDPSHNVLEVIEEPEAQRYPAAKGAIRLHHITRLTRNVASLTNFYLKLGAKKIPRPCSAIPGSYSSDGQVEIHLVGLDNATSPKFQDRVVWGFEGLSSNLRQDLEGHPLDGFIEKAAHTI